jgi:iron uptake system component EfeO
VELVDPATGAVYDDIENLGAGTTDPMRLDVGSGSYAFRCMIEDTDSITGPTEKVPGHTSGATAILPVTDDDLLAPAGEYHKYVTAGLVTLASQVATLNSAIESGNLAAARSASVTSFIENNWLHGQRLGGGSYDAIAGNLAGWGGVLDFHTWPHFKPVILDPTTGAVVSKN